MGIDFSIREWDPDDAPEEDFEARYELYLAFHAEQSPEDPIQPYDQYREGFRHKSSWAKQLRWDAVEGGTGRLLGTANLSLAYVETNRHLAWGGVNVAADARRNGIGTALAAKVVAAAKEDGRTLLGSGAPEDGVGEHFLEAVGATRKLRDRKSRLLIADVDRALMEEWVRKAKERADGYSLVFWEDRCPDEHLQRFIDLTHVMNTAPRDELEMEDFKQTPERFREGEDRFLAQGYTGWTLVVVEDATGEFAGFTELGFASYDPTVAWQGGTGVVPAHRNKGLGRWLKADMVLRLMDGKPAVEKIDTDNAHSNDPMLGINIAMGFKIVKSSWAWQVPTDVAEEKVAAKLDVAPA